MDFYMIGRILGVLFWPALIGAGIYGVGYVIAWTRPAEQAAAIRRWSAVAAIAACAAAAVMSLGRLLR